MILWSLYVPLFFSDGKHAAGYHHAPCRTVAHRSAALSLTDLTSVTRYDDAVVALKAKVKETEGEDMREAIQDKVHGLPVLLLST